MRLSNPTLSGELLAFVSEGDVWVTRLHQAHPASPSSTSPQHRCTAERPHRVTLTGTNASPRLSPDGTHIAFVSSGLEGREDVCVVPSGGGRIRTLVSASGACRVADWSWDSRSIYVHVASSHRHTCTHTQSVHRVPVSGEVGALHPVEFGGRSSAVFTHTSAGAANDGRGGGEVGATTVVVRNGVDVPLELWRGYRGGQQATVWSRRGGEEGGDQEFRQLVSIDDGVNASCVHWVVAHDLDGGAKARGRLVMIAEVAAAAGGRGGGQAVDMVVLSKEIGTEGVDPDPQSSTQVLANHAQGCPRNLSLDMACKSRGGEEHQCTPFTSSRLVYQLHGKLMLYDPDVFGSVPVCVEVPDLCSPLQRMEPKNVDVAEWLTEAALHPSAHVISTVARGRIHEMGLWDGPALGVGILDSSVRYSKIQYTCRGRLLMVCHEHASPYLAVARSNFPIPHPETLGLPFNLPGALTKLPLAPKDIGIPVKLYPSPVNEHNIAIVNNRHELLLIDTRRRVANKYPRGLVRRVDTCKVENGFLGVSWSPDGSWLAYAITLESTVASVIKIHNVKTGRTHQATQPPGLEEWMDSSPTWDPDGDFLFFLSARDMVPTQDHLTFDYHFTNCARPFALALRHDVPSPFLRKPLPPRAFEDDYETDMEDDEEDEEDCFEDDQSPGRAGSRKSSTGSRRARKGGDWESDGGDDAGDDEGDDEDGYASDDTAPRDVMIDMDQNSHPEDHGPSRGDMHELWRRIVSFPVTPARYLQILALADGHVMYTRATEADDSAGSGCGGGDGQTFTGSDDNDDRDDGGNGDAWTQCELCTYDWRKTHHEQVLIDDGVVHVELTPDAGHMLVTEVNSSASSSSSSVGFRVLVAGHKPPGGGPMDQDSSAGDGEGAGEWFDGRGWDEPGPHSGLVRVDDRVGSIIVDPAQEFAQMFHEVCGATVEKFHDEATATGWLRDVVPGYEAQLRNVACHEEFCDLVQEMLSYLGASHVGVYMGGDYDGGDAYRDDELPGCLGVEVAWDDAFQGYRVTGTVVGDHWNNAALSGTRSATGGSLQRLGSKVGVGEVIVAINGVCLGRDRGLEATMQGLAGKEVLVTVLNAQRAGRPPSLKAAAQLQAAANAPPAPPQMSKSAKKRMKQKVKQGQTAGGSASRAAATAVPAPPLGGSSSSGSGGTNPALAQAQNAWPFSAVPKMRRALRVVRTVASTADTEKEARYRDWVTQKRLSVRAQSGGTVGYVHVPDMDRYGYAAFHRLFAIENRKAAICVDLRGNVGGNVSELFLRLLTQRRIATIGMRGCAQQPYPELAVGRCALLVDEETCSDAEMLARAFQTLGLGVVIGNRSNGALLGVGADYELVDGTSVSLPSEHIAFGGPWAKFGSAGLAEEQAQIENVGVVPDVQVDDPPRRFEQQKQQKQRVRGGAGSDPADPVLGKAVEILLEQLGVGEEEEGEE